MEKRTRGLTANPTQRHQSVVIKLKVLASSGAQLASSSLPVQLKVGTSKLSASVSLPELPKNNDDLLWYRLAYNLTADETELANGILPLFESFQDFALHVSAPALVQPGKETGTAWSRASNDGPNQRPEP